MRLVSGLCEWFWIKRQRSRTIQMSAFNNVIDIDFFYLAIQGFIHIRPCFICNKMFLLYRKHIDFILRICQCCKNSEFLSHKSFHHIHSSSSHLLRIIIHVTNPWEACATSPNILYQQINQRHVREECYCFCLIDIFYKCCIIVKDYCQLNLYKYIYEYINISIILWILKIIVL